MSPRRAEKVRLQLVFFATGFSAGLVTLIIGSVSNMFLALGNGLVFFIALIIGIAVSGNLSRLASGWWRYAVGLGISSLAYVLWLFAFLAVSSVLPAISVKGIAQFRADIWLAFFAAVPVASLGVEWLAYVLTNRWSNASLFRLVIAGVLTVFVTLAIALFYQGITFWILLPLGNALYCSIIGEQIWGNPRTAGMFPSIL